MARMMMLTVLAVLTTSEFCFFCFFGNVTIAEIGHNHA